MSKSLPQPNSNLDIQGLADDLAKDRALKNEDKGHNKEGKKSKKNKEKRNKKTNEPSQGEKKHEQLEVQEGTQAQLELLSETIKADMNTLEYLTNQLKKDDVESWNGYEGGRTAADRLAEIYKKKKNLPEGIAALITGLRRPEDHPFNDAAQAELAKLVDVVGEYRKTIQGTQKKLEKFNEDVPTGHVREWGKGIMEHYKNADGFEKAITLGALGFGFYMIWTTRLKEYAKWGLAAFALNKVVAIASGKSFLEWIGFMRAVDQMPAYMSKFAKLNGMEDPRHAAGMVEMEKQKITIDRLYELYRVHRAKGEKAIPPESVGLLDGQLTGEELFSLIEKLIKKAGGRAEFEKECIGHGYTFFRAVSILCGREIVEEWVKNDKEATALFNTETEKIFGSAKKFKISCPHVTLGGFKIPGLSRGNNTEGKKPFYTVEFEKEEVVLLVDEDVDRSKHLDRVEGLVKKKIIASLKGTYFEKYTTDHLEFAADGKWMLRGVEITPGAKEDVQLHEGINDKIEFYIDGQKLPEGKDFKKSYELLLISRTLKSSVPFFKDVEVVVTEILADGKAKATIGGVEVELISSTANPGKYLLTVTEQAKLLAADSSFIYKKAEIMETHLRNEAFHESQLSTVLDSKYSNWLKGKPSGGANEQWFSFGSSFPWVDVNFFGSVDKSLWKTLVDMKLDNLLFMYRDRLSNSRERDLKALYTLEGDLQKEMDQQLNELSRALNERVKRSEEFSKEDFQKFYKQLLAVGFMTREIGEAVAEESARILKTVSTDNRESRVRIFLEKMVPLATREFSATELPKAKAYIEDAAEKIINGQEIKPLSEYTYDPSKQEKGSEALHDIRPGIGIDVMLKGAMNMIFGYWIEWINGFKGINSSDKLTEKDVENGVLTPVGAAHCLAWIIENEFNYFLNKYPGKRAALDPVRSEFFDFKNRTTLKNGRKTFKNDKNAFYKEVLAVKNLKTFPEQLNYITAYKNKVHDAMEKAAKAP